MDNTLSIRVASLTLLPVPFKVIYNIYTIHFALFTGLFWPPESNLFMGTNEQRNILTLSGHQKEYSECEDSDKQ